MKESAENDKLYAALVAALAECENPPLDGHADVQKYKYDFAKLTDVLNCSKPHLAKHGLGVMQLVSTTPTGPAVVTRIIHASGQWLETDPLILPVSRADPQGWGISITYARRYQLQALTAIVGEKDTDGADTRPPEPQQHSARFRQAAPPPKEHANGTTEQQAPARAQNPPKSLLEKLRAKQALMHGAGLCAEGELMDHLQAAGERAGAPEIERWAGVWEAFAREEVYDFELGAAKALVYVGRINRATREQVEYLRGSLASRDVSWNVVRTKCGFLEGSDLQDVTEHEWATALACLLAMPLKKKEKA